MTQDAKIVVVDLGFLGDTIHLLPALWTLRQAHPSAALHVVTTPVGAEVLAMVRCVDRVWVHPLGNPSPPWWRHLGLLRALRRERFGLSINFSGADRTLFVAAAAGARRRLTRQEKPFRLWQRWLAGDCIPAPGRSVPVFEQKRQVLAAAGYSPVPVRFDLQVPEPEAAWAGDRIPPGAVHASVNASSPYKEWPVQAWAEVIRVLLADGVPAFVATGSVQLREQDRLRALAGMVGDARLLVLSEGLSIARLTAIVQRCAAHFGTDSGVTHLAMAMGIPTVTVFREYLGYEEWRPRGEQHSAVSSPCGCVDQPSMDPACRQAGTALCLARIPPAEVISRARQILGATRPRGVSDRRGGGADSR